MAKSLQVTVTNPDDLNTLQGELVTQNYNLEILGLKNPADFRKFSKSLMMLDRILKETNDKVDNGLKTKLDKGSYEGDANDLKRELDDKVRKSGDTMTGELSIEDKEIRIIHKDSTSKAIGVYGVYKDQEIYGIGGFIHNNEFKHMYIGVGDKRWSNKSRKGMFLKPDGNVELYAKNLSTSNKEVVSAINELNSGKVSKNGDILEGGLEIKNATYPMKLNYITSTGFLSGGFARGYKIQIDSKDKAEFGLYGLDGEPKKIYIGKDYANTMIDLNYDGTTRIKASNLKTNSKEVIESINELNSKIASHCPYTVGDIYITTRSENPSAIWLGTTWQKIEGRMLLGTSGSGASKATGGSNTVTLSTANLPSHTHSASQSAHTHSQPAHSHPLGPHDKRSFSGNYLTVEYSDWRTTQAGSFLITQAAGGDTTGSATPSISIGATGSSAAFSILSAYYTVHIWLRTA